MKRLLFFLAFILPGVYSEAQNCPQPTCSISVNVSQDSCPASSQTLYTMVSSHTRICATDVPSAYAPVGPTLVAAHLVTPFPCVINPMNTSSIESVYFNLTGLNSRADGASYQTWLKSPQGT